MLQTIWRKASAKSCHVLICYVLVTEITRAISSMKITRCDDDWSAEFFCFGSTAVVVICESIWQACNRSSDNAPPVASLLYAWTCRPLLIGHQLFESFVTQCQTEGKLSVWNIMTRTKHCVAVDFLLVFKLTHVYNLHHWKGHTEDWSGIFVRTMYDKLVPKTYSALPSCHALIGFNIPIRFTGKRNYLCFKTGMWSVFGNVDANEGYKWRCRCQKNNIPYTKVCGCWVLSSNNKAMEQGLAEDCGG